MQIENPRRGDVAHAYSAPVEAGSYTMCCRAVGAFLRQGVSEYANESPHRLGDWRKGRKRWDRICK